MRNRSTHPCCKALLLGVLLFSWAAQTEMPRPEDTLEFRPTGTYLSLTEHAYWLEESADSMTPQQALEQFESGAFQRAAGDWMELGILDGTVWCVFTVTNTTSGADLIIEVRNPRTSYVDLYEPQPDGTFRVQKSGSALPFSERRFVHPMPAYPVQITPGQTKTFLIRAHNVGDMRLRFWIWTPFDFINHASKAYISDWIALGVLFVLCIYHFLVFISLRESSYLYLSGFILSWMLFYMASTEIGAVILWGDFAWLKLRCNSLFFVLMCASFILFAMSFLESRRITPVLFRVSLAYIGLLAVHFIYICLTDSGMRMIINRYVGMVSILLVIVLVARAWQQGSRMALMFIVSWLFVVIGGVLLVFLNWYVLSARWVLGTPIISILYASSILLWSFELTGRVKGRVREQRELLERQVKERTRDLEQALSEVKTLSGLLPICSSCKSIRDDTGYWSSVEHYIMQNTEADFTHGICPDCMKKLYPEIVARREGGANPA